MKKMPCAVERTFDGPGRFTLTGNITPECELWVERGTPTIKRDGTAAAIINGELYARYDAKKGKQPPDGAIPCQPEPDPVTGHWPHWVPATRPQDKWIREARGGWTLPDGTYEACGPKIAKSEGLDYHVMFRHGSEVIIDLNDRSFDGLRNWLENHRVEGIVFWYAGEPRCKVRRHDFGLEW
ncbi:MAG: hypothetical protein KDE23_24895 [Caldilinea sp.]|nr:hypothetical protein [Caldilinea sp.]